MRKLRLDLEELVVETFRTSDGAAGAGTVHGARAFAYAADSGDSDCANCFSADPCTNIPIATCTCGCEATVPVEPVPANPVAETACVATSPCTCRPEETCSCGFGYF